MSTRVHVVVGSPWREAVLKHLDPGLPYQPWPEVPDLRENDSVLVVFDTEPRLALAPVATFAGELETTIAQLDRRWTFSNAVPLSYLGVQVTGRHLVVDDGTDLLANVESHRFGAPRVEPFGPSSMAQALTLLGSNGRCTVCGIEFDAESVVVRAAEVGDWPAVLCGACQQTMTEFDSFLAYRFSLHPSCPACGAQRTRQALFGLPVSMGETPPWCDQRGCCITDQMWTCGVCHHEW